MASSAAAFFLAAVALLFASAAARPGGPFHPCNTLFVTYTISTSSSAAADGSAAPHRAFHFVSISRIITPFSSSSAYAFRYRRPMLIRRTGVPRLEVARPAALGFTSLQERAKDIFVVVFVLLFAVFCGALTAASMYFIWSLVSHQYEISGEEDEDYASESPKKAGYVKIPAAAEPAPAKEGYEGN